MGTTGSTNKLNEIVKMHEYKKETLRGDRLVALLLE